MANLDAIARLSERYDTNTPVPIPQSIDGVEQLVKQLYSPAPPSQVVRIQEGLLKVQHSADGWQLADVLLGNSDEKVRFFGALTFAVKLNADWESLDDDASQALLARLLSWLIRLSAHDEGALVLKKLCSALVSYFLRLPSKWQRCIRHLLTSLNHGEVVPVTCLDQVASTEHLLASLNYSQIIVSLWFSAGLVEEVGKIDSSSMKHQNFHQKLGLNVDDAVCLLRFALTMPGSVSLTQEDRLVKIRQEGIRCLQSWINYSHRAYVDSAIVLDPLKQLTRPAISFLVHDEMFESTCELFTDVLANYPSFLTPADMHMLSASICSPWAQTHMDSLKDGDFESDVVQFGRFLLAFGDAAVQDLAHTPNHQNTRQIMNMLHSLLTCKGYPVAEDEICVQALEFWATFVEFMVDALFAESEEKLPWFGPARDNIVKAIEECWAKIRTPDVSLSSSWDSETKKGFNDFRKDVGDLLQSSYPLLGIDIFARFVDLAISSFDKGDLEDGEAFLFCLSALSDSISHDVAEDKVLGRLFGSSMFTTIINDDMSLPTKARRTAVNLLGHYTPFFERHADNLASALTFLFECLDLPSMAISASRSINSLCSSCRRSLTSEIGAFLHQYDQISEMDGSAKERVLGAIAAVIQALPREEDKLEPMRRLLEYVQQDVALSLGDWNRGNNVRAKEAGLDALRCLSGIGKGLQEVTDAPIDLESTRPKSTFWTKGDGSFIQRHIVHMIDSLTDALYQAGDVIEAACAVYRTGFTETSSGPFVFAPEVTARFLLKSNLNTPRLGLVLTTACALMSSHSTDSSAKIDTEAHMLLSHVANFVQQLGDPQEDPEIAQNCVEFLHRLIPRYFNVVLALEPQTGLERLFMFTLQCLKGGDLLPKRAAASFWASFVVLLDQPEPTQSAINTITQHMGPLVAEALIINIGGGAARSELDTVAAPLKRLVFKQPRSKMWLERALFNETFPSDKVDSNEKRAFLQKVMSLRGAKGTNQVVKDFWLACRGSNFAYAS